MVTMVTGPEAPLVTEEPSGRAVTPGVPAPSVQGAGEALAVPWAFVSTCQGAEL